MLSNSMSFVEVREIFSAVGLVATEESAEILQRALRACDVDGDGRVDFGELTQLLSGDSLRAAFPDIEGYVRCVFRGLDADGDGILSMAELRRMFYAMGYQPEDAGGFGDLGLLAATETNCPNNAPPMFWKSGEYAGRQWMPLLERRL